MQPGIHAGADGRKHRRLGKDLGVGADADSRYWLQAFWSISTCFSFDRLAEPA
jgi:hypothetical protein